MALALRLALALSANEQSVCTPDSADYKSLMTQMAGEGRFDSTFRTPGYPAFLLMTLTWGWQCVLLVQIALDCGLVVLTFLIGRKLISHQAGLLGALLQAVSPLAIASSCRILSDSLYAFMLAVVMLLLVRHFSSLREDVARAADAPESGDKADRVDQSGRTWKALVLAAVVLGAATYVRPIGMMMAVPIFLVLLWGRRGLVRAGTFAVIFVACLAPWVSRNIHTQNYCGFSTFAVDSFANYVAAPIVLGKYFWNPSSSSVDRNFWTKGAWTDWRLKLTKQVLQEHPLMVAKYQIKGAPIFWLPDATDVLEVAGLTEGNRGTLAVLRDEGIVAAIKRYFGSSMNDWTVSLTAIMLIVYVIWAVGLAAFLVAGVRRIVKSRLRMPAEAWIIILLVLLSMLAPGPAGHPRFRVPLEPYLCIASAAGWLGLFGVLAARRRRNCQLTIDD